MTKVIEIIVAPNGETKIETKGFAGPECREASQFIERSLGRSSGEQLTADFHRVDVRQQSTQRQ